MVFVSYRKVRPFALVAFDSMCCCGEDPVQRLDMDLSTDDDWVMMAVGVTEEVGEVKLV